MYLNFVLFLLDNVFVFHGHLYHYEIRIWYMTTKNLNCQTFEQYIILLYYTIYVVQSAIIFKLWVKNTWCWITDKNVLFLLFQETRKTCPQKWSDKYRPNEYHVTNAFWKSLHTRNYIGSTENQIRTCQHDTNGVIVSMTQTVKCMYYFV